jgi:hypothetical protein
MDQRKKRAADRKITESFPNPSFIPYPVGQRCALDGCITRILHAGSLPLFSSPLGETVRAFISPPGGTNMHFLSPGINVDLSTFSQFQSHGPPRTQRRSPADEELRCHLPARSRCNTSPFWCLFVIPPFGIRLDLDPTSRRCFCPLPILRLRYYLAKDFHLASSVPCLAHTASFSRARPPPCAKPA